MQSQYFPFWEFVSLANGKQSLKEHPQRFIQIGVNSKENHPLIRKSQWINVHDFFRSIKLYIALRDRNLEELETYALDISDPHSENYGKQLSFERNKV